MGLFANPLSYAGYPPKVTGTPTTQNTTVRAATQEEVDAGIEDGAYISPASLSGTAVAPSVSGASPIVNNSRRGQVRFSDVVNNGSYSTLTMTNDVITDASTVILCSVACATSNCRISIVNITPTAGSVNFRVYNAGSASSDTDVVINYMVVN